MSDKVGWLCIDGNDILPSPLCVVSFRLRGCVAAGRLYVGEMYLTLRYITFQ